MVKCLRARESAILVFISGVAKQRENKNQNYTRISALKQFATTEQTLINFLHDLMNPFMTIKKAISHIDSVSHSQCPQSGASFIYMD